MARSRPTWWLRPRRPTAPSTRTPPPWTLTNDGEVTASDDTLVRCPGLNITKDADDPETVAAGDTVGFTIEVTNDEGDGIGTATAVTLADPLPAGDGVSWSVESQSGGAGCSVNGSAPAQTLVCGPIDLAPGAGFSVHVVSDTEPTGEECVVGNPPEHGDGRRNQPRADHRQRHHHHPVPGGHDHQGGR